MIEKLKELRKLLYEQKSIGVIGEALATLDSLIAEAEQGAEAKEIEGLIVSTEQVKKMADTIVKIISKELPACSYRKLIYDYMGLSPNYYSALYPEVQALTNTLVEAEQKPEMPKHKPDCSYEKSKGKDPIMPCTCDYTTRLEEYCQKPVCKTCDGDEIIEVDVEEVADFAKVLRGEIKK